MTAPSNAVAAFACRRRRSRRVLALLVGVLGASVASAARGAPRGEVPPAPRLAISRTAPPARLADTGLYADVAAKVVAADCLPYAPQYPLWTDGATKARWLRLPPGTTIDAHDVDAWSFPVGTRLWKEFALERRVETRYLERAADGWIFATYVWSDDERDAVLAPARGVRHAAESRPGVPYDVPGRADCRACHDGRATPVLGVSALQLSPDRDPLAPHAERPRDGDLDLRALVARGLVVGLPDAMLAHPPRIDAPSPRARAALGWLHANCGACHTADGGVDGVDLVLEARLASSVATASPIATTVGRASRFRLPGRDGTLDVRVVPGDPARSVLWRRLASRNPLVQMPPLGTHAVDAEASALVEAWIREDLASPAAPSVPAVPASPSPNPLPLPENVR